MMAPSPVPPGSAADRAAGSEHGPAELAPGVHVAPDGLRLQFSRSGGPGGQNVNKLNTKAELWVALSQMRGLSAAVLQRLRRLAGRRLTAADELHLSEENRRSQQANRQEVFRRLRDLILAAQVQPKRRRKTRPTAASRRRRLDSKRRRSQLKAQRHANDLA